MTREEAVIARDYFINEIDKGLVDDDIPYETLLMYGLAREALEMQLPLKLKITSGGQVQCSACKRNITNKGCVKPNIKYCPRCGQMIDWTD